MMLYWGMGRIWIGTSGWVYKGWAKTFYPEEIPASRQFHYYATQFPTVEINATFYGLPTTTAVRGWRKKSPPGFQFAVKGSRYITHMKKLQHVAAGLKKYFLRIKNLSDRTGPVLWQLPPFLQKDLPRLDKFLGRLPEGYRYAIEFRHPSWMDSDTLEL